MSNNYRHVEYTIAATIVAGNTATNVDLVDQQLVGIFIPAAFTGTTLAVQACATVGGTFVPVTDGAGAALSLTVAPSKFVAFSNLALTAGLRYVRLVSGSTEAADRVLTLATRAG